eukprot:6193737-Pleurochrysis_carterae.AAC.1
MAPMIATGVTRARQSVLVEGGEEEDRRWKAVQYSYPAQTDEARGCLFNEKAKRAANERARAGLSVPPAALPTTAWLVNTQGLTRCVQISKVSRFESLKFPSRSGCTLHSQEHAAQKMWIDVWGAESTACVPS